MANYSEIVPFELAVKLREAGYPQDECGEGYDSEGHLTSYYWKTYAAPLYAQVLDWLIGEGVYIYINAFNTVSGLKGHYAEYEGFVVDLRIPDGLRVRVEKGMQADYGDWFDCATDSIYKALEILSNKN